MPEALLPLIHIFMMLSVRTTSLLKLKIMTSAAARILIIQFILLLALAQILTIKNKQRFNLLLMQLIMAAAHFVYTETPSEPLRQNILLAGLRLLACQIDASISGGRVCSVFRFVIIL